MLGLPVVRIPHSQCRGPRFSPGQGTRSTCCNYDPEQKKKKKKTTKLQFSFCLRYLGHQLNKIKYF